jgi:alpha-methylacyl-CoA racemase
VTGALDGLRVVEFGSTGPAPFCAMILADHGADVVRVDRPGGESVTPAQDGREELLHRNRRSIALDLKSPGDLDTARHLSERADVVIEGNRPGVMERLGLGPDVLCAANPRLVYARMTGWGQDGPYANEVGHDLNYLSISGALSLLGPRSGPPTIPLALVGDFGGGGLVLAFGIMAALFERTSSGEGQVIDASILDGVALMSTAFTGYAQTGGWSAQREDNLIDGGAPFYNVYETADGEWVSVGALEPRFYRALLTVLGIDDIDPARQGDKTEWEQNRLRFASVIRARTRAEWVARAAGSEACLTPVLSLEEARLDRHAVQRQSFATAGGIEQPVPAPRFSRATAGLRSLPPRPGEQTTEILRDWGLSPAPPMQSPTIE